VKIERDKHEAAELRDPAQQSRKEFETKLQMLKMRKGTLATQIAAARSAGGDAFGNDSSVWDRFAAAEDRIDSEAIATESMRRCAAEELEDRRSTPSGGRGRHANLLGAPGAPEAEDALAKLKAKMQSRRPPARSSSRERQPGGRGGSRGDQGAEGGQ